MFRPQCWIETGDAEDIKRDQFAPVKPIIDKSGARRLLRRSPLIPIAEGTLNKSTIELEMALNFYGYGRWDAAYWFIGPEPGVGPGQPAGHASLANAWIKSGKCELCDCLKFQAAIPDPTWHASTPPLQATWSKLILLLKTYLNEPTDNDSLREYQRDKWGRIENGQTCVIELSGMAAKGLDVIMDRQTFRFERLAHIREKMLEHKPQLVVMYGLRDQPHFEIIVGRPLVRDVPVKSDAAIVVLTKHPVAFGGKRADWIELGHKLRAATS